MPLSDPTQSFQILPSILSSDFTRLGEQASELKKGGCPILHLDVMDGHFVPNLTFGPPVVKSLAAATDLEFDIHLMVDDPDAWTEAFDFPNTRCLTIHAEAGYHTHRSLQKIRDKGKMAGLALNPATPLDCLEYLWPSIDLVLIMTVNPGFGGQSFIPACLEKIRKVRHLIETRTDGNVVLEIDGGVGSKNIGELAKEGAQWAVTGNALFGAKEGLQTQYASLLKEGEKNWRSPRK
jgi:ribulose-phosphate 3-epimerase